MEDRKCKICGSKTELVFDRQFEIDYFHCKKCDFLFMDESCIVPPDKEKSLYCNHNNSFENKGYVNMFREFIETFIIHFDFGIKTALDFGSGPGPVLAALLEEKGFDVDIYDLYFSPERIFQNKTYDLITCTEVLEHLNQPLETLKLFQQHLNQNGILAVTTMFHPGIGEEFQSWWYRRDRTHICFYTPKTLRYISDVLGFEILMIGDKKTCIFKKLH